MLRILAAANPDDMPLLIIPIHTAARIDELLRLKWQDVNFEQRTVTLWTRKKKDGNWKPRYVPINNDLYRALWPLWVRREQEEWVLYNRKEDNRYNRRPKLMSSICKRAGVNHYGFHSIRHFTATHLHDEKKVATGVIGGILGHESKQTTEVYLHSIDGAAVDAMSRLDGIFDDSMLALLPEKDGKSSTQQNRMTAEKVGA